MPATNAAPTARQVQMNTRIDAGAAVRGLWRFVVDHQDDAAAVREVIEPDAASALSDEASRKAAAISDLRSLYEQTACELGIPSNAEADLPSWDDLREDWYAERLEGEV